ncbi:MAG: alpha/beta hydrolase, partial [Pseudomonadota bacterium]|nr:alpha/beta hydrolase [Pseudomonadota bacterium]
LLTLLYLYLLRRNSQNNRNENARRVLLEKPFTKINHEFVSTTLAALTEENSFSSLKYNGWFSITNKQRHERELTPLERQGLVNKLFSPEYPLVKCTNIDREIDALPEGKRGIKLRLISPWQQSPHEIIFYIPGTASVTTSSSIELSIGNHLAHALNCQVLIIDHELAPTIKWPHILAQICTMIKHYMDTHPNLTVYYLAGFSTGGYFATLATFILGKLDKHFSRLILFAPMLDVGAEFRRPEYSEFTMQQLKQLPLPDDFKKQTVEKLNTLRKHIDPNEYFEKDFSGLHESLITDCFPRYKYQLEDLRTISPLWFNKKSFHPRLFPDTTIILGQTDCFRIDSELFFAKLKDDKCKVTKIILPVINHALIWKNLYPIYLAQLITKPDRIDNTSFNEILEYDAILRLENSKAENQSSIAKPVKKESPEMKEQRLLDETTHLKTLCKSFNWLRSANNVTQPADDKNLKVPIYSSYDP